MLIGLILHLHVETAGWYLVTISSSPAWGYGVINMRVIATTCIVGIPIITSKTAWPY